MIYADTSIVAAHYCDEPLSEVAEDALVNEPQPVISQLVEVELYSAVARKVREGHLSEALAVRITSMFRAHIDQGYYARVALDHVHYEMAREWIGRFSVPLRSLDALHLACTFVCGATLVTADTGLHGAAEHFGVPSVLLSGAP